VKQPTPRLRVRTEIEEDNGWTRWVFPRMERYRMFCCDCGLGHTLQFRVYTRGPENARGSYQRGARALPRGEFAVAFRAHRLTKKRRAAIKADRSARAGKKGRVK
jgi:hypothetical protein